MIQIIRNLFTHRASGYSKFIYIIKTYLLLMLANCTSGGKAFTLPVGEIEQRKTVHEVIVFVGNPDVGKSSLINAIIQEPVFKSGVSADTDLTRQEQFYSHGDKLYIDTPGIDDINLKQQAAVEIEKALKHDNKYKIVFMATLASGRIRPTDIVSINTVCAAIRTDFEYGLIINGVMEEAMKEIGGAQGIMKFSKEKLYKQPSSILTLGFEWRLYDKEDEYFSERSRNKEALAKFVNQLTAKDIKQEDVAKLDVRDYEEKVAALEEAYKKELAATMEKQLQVTEEKWKRQEERHKADQERYRADQEKQEVKHKEELASLGERYAKEHREREGWFEERMQELKTGDTPLHTAAWQGDVKKVQVLLQTRANIEVSDKDGWKPLFYATAKGNVEIIQALLQAQAHIKPLTKDGWTALHIAASNGRLGAVQALLQAEANIEAPDKDGWTPLHHAASNGDAEVVQALLQAKANIEATDKDSNTPLHIATSQGQVETVQALLQAQANIEPLNKDGWTPLHVAASSGNLEAVQALLRVQANIEPPTKDGCTPLHTATGEDNVEMVQALIQAQAEITTTNKSGMTPLQVAASQGQLAMVRVLTQAEANIKN